jgi:hypothetical protein
MSMAVPSTHKGPFAEPLLPLSGHSGHGRTCCWLDPVVNDPSETSAVTT